MHLTARFDCVRHEHHTDAACGLILFDQATARTIHETGCYLGKTHSPHHALLLALLRMLDLALPSKPQRLELACTSELLIRQITGELPISDPAERDLVEQAMAMLLKLDIWQISLTDDADRAQVSDLARRALLEACDVNDLDLQTSDLRHHPDHTGVPQWTIELLEDPGDQCPARCNSGRRYAFGPDTPAGLCVHAAIGALIDGPLCWPDPDQQRMTTSCAHCGTPLRIERASSDRRD